MSSRAARRFLVCAVLSPGVSHFRSFSLVYAVNFAVSIFACGCSIVACLGSKWQAIYTKDLTDS